MKKISLINGAKILIFVLIACIMFAGILNILNYKSTGGGGGFQHFYSANENSIDVMFFGSSHAHCTIDHGYLWDNYGIAGYTLSAGSQNIDSTYYFIKEALRVQKPEIIVVEMLGATGGEIENTETDVYRNSLSMKWSSVFFEYTDYLADNMEMEKTWKEQIYTKIPIVHSRYAELTQEDFQDNIPFMMGYRGSYENESFEEPTVTSEIGELNPEKREWLQKIVDLAKVNNVEIVLFASPCVLSQEQQMQFNAIEAFAEENNVQYINYNKLYKDIGLNFKTDFRDSEHVNNYGAVKVTEHIADFLKDNYALEDRRGQSGYSLWEDNALYLRNKALRHELENASDINDYLQILSEMEEEQTVIIALTGNYNVLGDVYLENLMKLGITADEYAQGGVWVFRNREKFMYLPGKEYRECIKTPSGEIHLESSSYLSQEDEMIENVKLIVNAEDYYQVENGVNMIVYNEELNQLIDAAGDDVYLGLELVHCEKTEE